MANAFKFEKDDTSYNEIFKASEGFTQKSKNTNYTTRNVLKDFDSIYNKKYEDVLNADILLFDAQTSGGLLLAVDEKDAMSALNNLKSARYECASIIGKVTKRAKNKNLISILP